MGANFINSLLEEFSKILERELEASNLSTDEKRKKLLL